ncbi:MAG: hypothetical protein LUE92_07365 [Clostridiales bacterium]|nr:hypothetical protein [Clostridiales bacterium]
MSALAVIGIFAALALMTFLVYKGFHPALAAIVCVLVIIVTNNMDFAETMSSAWEETGSLYGTMVPLFIFGGILSMLYVESGAITSLSNLFLKPVGLCKNQKTGLVIGLTFYMLLALVIGVGGIDCYSVVPLLVALALGFCAKLNIPNKFAVSMGIISMTFICIIPGTAQTMNIMAESFVEGFNNKEQVPLRLLVMFIYLILCIAVMTFMISRAQRKGEIFVENQGTLAQHGPKEERVMPWIIPFIPIVVVEALYIAAGMSAWVCMALGCVVGLICFGPWLMKRRGEKSWWTHLCDVLGRGTTCIPLQMLVVGVISTVLGISPGLTTISDFFGSSNISAAVACMVICVIVMGFTGTTGLIAVAPVAAAIFMPKGLSAMAIVMIALWGKSVFDTLPINSMIPIMCDMTGDEFKKAYPTVFVTTVILTFVMTILVTGMSAAGLF